MPVRLRERTLVNFRNHAFPDPRDHAYRWVDVKHYDLAPKPREDQPDTDTVDTHMDGLDTSGLDTNEAVLRALIRDADFADGYAGAGPDPTGEIHGPYRLRHITPAAYQRVDAAAAVSVIELWARRHGSLPTDLVEALREHVHTPIHSATSRYQLKDLGEPAHHDWAGIHTEFHELVAIDRARRTLTLLVAADD